MTGGLFSDPQYHNILSSRLSFCLPWYCMTAVSLVSVDSLEVATCGNEIKATSHLTIFMRAKGKIKGIITNTGKAGRLLRGKRRRCL